MIEWASGRKAEWRNWEWHTDNPMIKRFLETMTVFVLGDISVPNYGKRVVEFVAKITGAKVVRDADWDGPEVVNIGETH